MLDHAVPIIFGNFVLQNERYIVQDIDIYSSAKKSISKSELARDDGAVSYGRRLNSKSAVANGIINCATTTELETAIDDLKRACYRDQTNLDVGYLGGYRRYIAEVENVIISRKKGDITIAAFSIEFSIDKPYATDVDVSVLIPQQDLTLGTNVININVGGTYKAEPTFELLIKAINNTTTPVQLTIANPVTAQAITIERVFAVNDTITLDTLNKNVYVNNDIVGFMGQMPKFDPGDGTVEVSDTATTRTIGINAQYNKRHL